MDPRLACITGPLQGQVFSIAQEVSIGRERLNHIVISDPSVSRQHCLISRQGQEFELCDLDSRNGISVNGATVQTYRLHHGDAIDIGTSVFVFLLSDGDVERGAESVHINDQMLFSRSTVQLVRTGSFYRPPPAEIVPPEDRLSRSFGSLLKLSTAIKSDQGLQSLQRQLVDLLFEVIPAQRAAVLLFGTTPGELTSAYGREKNSEMPVEVSRTVIEHVLKEQAVLAGNSPTEQQVAQNGPIHRVAAFLAAPIALPNSVRGVLYLDTSDASVRFDDTSAELLSAAAAIAAMPLENARQLDSLRNENQRLQAEIASKHNMVGDSKRMRDVHVFVAKVAPSNAPVLIQGESGTGKELVARALHRRSSRASQRFLAINCAVLTESLLESELFGHEKGAFTGAVALKKGKIELAAGGTLFLDEVGELNPIVQAKLLRVLQEHEFERVGGTQILRADIRIIAASNRDLADASKNGAFRQDLYYRLNVVSVVMPPLRERREDIPLLAAYFIALHREKTARRVTGLSASARACVMSYAWPGNVRELENAIQRALIMGSSELIMPDDLPESVAEAETGKSTQATDFHRAVKHAKRQIVATAISQAGGDMTRAADALGIHPTNLYRLVRMLDLKNDLQPKS